MNLNSGIGKTEWVRTQLMPFLEGLFNGITYINIEDGLPIRRIMGKECARSEIDGCFDALAVKIASAAESSEIIIVDEAHWLFPSADPTPQGGVFRFDATFSRKQSTALELVNDLMKNGKKIIFISWLHPQDLSLTGSFSHPKDNCYEGTASMLRIFTIPVVEMRTPIQEVDG